MAITITEGKKKCDYEDAMDFTGFGKYNIAILATCCLLILAMYLDIFGFSVILPAVACDMSLSTAQQGLLSAVPLVGVMLSSYGWGLCADTLGRRTTLLLAMPAGAFFNIAASLAPDYATLAVIKFFSASFTSSANAAGFVLLGESVPKKYRSRFMFYMVMATMFAQFIICIFAIPIFQLSFRIELPLISMEYRPWRLLMQVISLPGVIGCVCIVFLKESPKFLLCRDRREEAMDVLRFIYRVNSGNDMIMYPVSSILVDDLLTSTNTEVSFLRRMWSQTAPLFKPPLLKNSVKLYYLLLCAYMTSTGYTMWVPTITNAYFDGNDASGKTFCEVASQSASSSNSTSSDCDNTIQPMTLYAVMVYSGVSSILTISLSFIVGPLGKKRTTLLVFTVSLIGGVLLMFIKIPMFSVMLFYVFLYVALILGNVNTYLVELNPTHLRGMATCLSVVVARGFGFISVQLIGAIMTDYCTPMVSGYIVLVGSGFVVALFLPPDEVKENHKKNTDHDQSREEKV